MSKGAPTAVDARAIRAADTPASARRASPAIAASTATHARLILARMADNARRPESLAASDAFVHRGLWVACARTGISATTTALVVRTVDAWPRWTETLDATAIQAMWDQRVLSVIFEEKLNKVKLKNKKEKIYD